MVARPHHDRSNPDQTGFLVRTVHEGQGFATPDLTAVLREVRRTETGPDTYVLQVDVGSGTSLIVELRPDDLALFRGESVVGIQHRKGTPRMRARAPRHLPIARVDHHHAEEPREPGSERRDAHELGFLLRV